jgi:dephospho-CoA kinase
MPYEKTAILICGKMRAGKTTAANYYRDSYEAEVYSLADKLKQLHRTFTGKLTKNRAWLQLMGQSCRRVFGDDFWVDRLCEQIAKDKPRIFVVDDVRYENELERLVNFSNERGYKVKVLFVKVSLESQIKRKAETLRMSHESEHFATKLQNSLDNDDMGVEYEPLEQYVFVVDGNLPMPDYCQELLRIVQPRDLKNEFPGEISYECNGDFSYTEEELYG